jgi:hypothetical protein
MPGTLRGCDQGTGLHGAQKDPERWGGSGCMWARLQMVAFEGFCGSALTGPKTLTPEALLIAYRIAAKIGRPSGDLTPSSGTLKSIFWGQKYCFDLGELIVPGPGNGFTFYIRQGHLPWF